MAMKRTYSISTCPVLVMPRVTKADGRAPDDVFPEPCGAELSALIEVSADGPECGVWVDDYAIRPKCGHSMTDIARAERDTLSWPSY